MKKILFFLSAHPVSAAAASLWLKTVIVSGFGFSLSFSSGLGGLLFLLSPLGPVMLAVSLSFLFSRRIRPAALLIIMTALTILLYANLLYYRFYIDFVTLPVLFQLNNVGGLGSSTAELLAPSDVLLFLDLLFFGWLFRTVPQQYTDTGSRAAYRFTAAGAGFLGLTLLLAFMQNPHILQSGYDRSQLVESLGLYNYQFYNALVTVSAPLSKAAADQSDIRETEDYFSQKTGVESPLFGAAEGKNVVLISLESTQDFVIGQKVHGKEMTPFLNSLTKHSFYFSNIYDQTAQGKTSDAEFIVDNGLYPLASGSVFVRYPANAFVSLPRILAKEAGYTSAVFHGNERTFWNRNEAYEALGYDRFFSEEDYSVTEENSVNYGIKDVPFFEQSMDKLTALPEPFFAKFITLTNHFPFLLEEEDRMIRPAETDVEVVNRYVTTVRYEDEAVKRFFMMMKERGMYKDTIFLLYGDHYGISEEYELGVHQLLGEEDTAVNHVQLQQVPLIIHIPGHPGKTVETVGGQIDIRATLLHLLGISTEGYLSFSQDLFTRTAEPVIFRDGSMVSEELIYYDHSCYRTDTEQQTDSRHCLVYEEEIRTQLNMSDRLIIRDLFRLREEDE